MSIATTVRHRRVGNGRSKALIVATSDHVVRPEFVYRRRWHHGDLVMSDNSTVQRKRS